jgi:(1->4)-alpha-D-glucan 1-alpha-D-glucosylmutase
VLGEPYGDALEGGHLDLVFEGGAFVIRYGERRFPVAPPSYARVLEHRLDELERGLGEDAPALAEYQSILSAIRNLPRRTEVEPARVAERAREKEVIKRRLAALAAEHPAVGAFIADNLARFNGTPGDPASFDLLDDLLEHQCYRLSHWLVATDEINYRRFFDVNDLAALRIERPEVFEATHALVLRLVSEGKLDGLRIDHPDGLFDPGEYFQRLRERGVPFVVAEKILAAGEPLVEAWPVDGTCGYELLNEINGLFVDGGQVEAFTALYGAITGEDLSFAQVAYEKKVLILNASLASELHMLTHQLDELAQKRRASRDVTFNTLRDALREVIACFPVYRSYIGEQGPRDLDRRHVETAVRRAALRNPLMSFRVLRFIRDLLLEPPPAGAEEDRAERRRFAGTFQQVTAPVMAKGVEDTAFYVYNRLVSLNEVGGDPGRFGVSPEALHRFCAERQRAWPHALSPLSTHDTKRSEDVRARLDVLSELPDAWGAAVARWRRLNEPQRLRVDDLAVPDPNAEYLLYQTLVGVWPLEGEATGEPPRAPAPGLHGKGAPRGQGAHELDQSQRALRRRRARVRGPHPGSGAEPRVPRRLRGVPAPDQPLRALQLAVPDVAAHRVPRRAGHLPGHRGVALRPGGSRQSPAGGLRAAPGHARGARARGGDAGPGPGEARPRAHGREGGRAREALPDVPRAALPPRPSGALQRRRLSAPDAGRGAGGALLRLRAPCR